MSPSTYLTRRDMCPPDGIYGRKENQPIGGAGTPPVTPGIPGGAEPEQTPEGWIPGWPPPQLGPWPYVPPWCHTCEWWPALKQYCTPDCEAYDDRYNKALDTG